MRIGLRTIKTAVGAAIAIFIAEKFQLNYAVS
ncbi:MAG: aromatic acid exporter family protein, partial [Carnobacterium maltaromaticum]